MGTILKHKRRIVPLFGSVQLKFALTYIILIFAILVVLNIYPILVSQDLVFKSKQSSLSSKAAVAASALTGLEYLSAEGVGQVMDILDDMDLSRLMITDSKGLVLYDTKVESEQGKYALFPEIVMALRGNDVFFSEFRENVFLSKASLPVMYKNAAIGAVYVYEEDSEQAGLLLGIQSNIFNLSIVVSFFVLLLSIVLSSALTRKIGEILRSIRIVREGEYSHRIQVSGRDELSLLAGEFNELTGRLQITEEVRRRFVSDASHELKTPLASIRLLADSILHTESIDVDMTREFVEDIGNEAERLARITEKLLDLTRLDADLKLESHPVNVKTIVRRAFHMLKPLAEKRNVRLKHTMEDNCIVLATEDDIYQTIFNLVENGIKYNVENGLVQVRLYKRDCKVIFVVEDTGIGIPDEDRDRIFDRFYRVDKARSREAGGTGLGLSIVKDTVLKHGGVISLESRGSGGARFMISFPFHNEVRQ